MKQDKRSPSVSQAQSPTLYPPVPDGLVPLYRQAFVPSHFTPFAIQTEKQNRRRTWFTETRSSIFLTDEKLVAHLSARYWVGPVPHVFTRSIILDLDRRSQWQSLDQRTEAARAALGEAAPLIFSTPSGGRHLFFMLDTPAWSNRAASFAKDRLTDAGVEIAPGKVEVFPSGSKAIRAPLGKDCWLLDGQNLEPVVGDREGHLHTLAYLLRNEQYDTLTIPVEYQTTETPDIPSDALRRAVEAVQPSSSGFMREVDRLLRDGLWRESQRNDAFLKLTWLMRVVWGFNADRTKAELRAWIDDYHNGKSQEYNADPEAVYRKIGDAVRCFNPDLVGRPSSHKAPVAPLKAVGGLEEAIAGFVDAQALDTQERVFLAKLLEYAHRRGEVTLDGELVVQIPSRTLKSFHYQYGPIIRTLQMQGCLAKARNYTTWGRCTSYRVPFLEAKNHGLHNTHST